MRQTGPYLVFCGATVALLVFLNATQPFVLSRIFGLAQSGAASGMLALVDEITAVVLGPLWGALSDKVGTRHVAVAGLWFMLLGLVLYPRAGAVVPTLLVVRAIFAAGAAGAVAMIPAALAELSLLTPGPDVVTADGGAGISPSDSRGSPAPGECRQYSGLGSERPAVSSGGAPGDGPPCGFGTSGIGDPHAGEPHSLPEGDETVPLFEPADSDVEGLGALTAAPRPNGRLAGLAGLAAGLGAVFAVTVLLPLPTQLDHGEHGGEVGGLVRAFDWVAGGGLVVSVALLAGLYQNPARGLRSFLMGSTHVSIFDEAAVDAGGSVMSYLELLKDGFALARQDRRLAVAYLGSLVARSASVVLALFVPLWVNQWYYATGRCRLPAGTLAEDPDQRCHDAIVRAAILTGVANSVVLLAAPAAGIAGDRLGSVSVLGTSAVIGVAATLLLLVASTPMGALPLAAAALLGAAQSGCATVSMAMSTDRRRVSPGSVAGVYSLAGSLGILAVTQFGGPLADLWLKAPFLIMASIFTVLALACRWLAKRTVLRSMRSAVFL